MRVTPPGVFKFRSSILTLLQSISFYLYWYSTVGWSGSTWRTVIVCSDQIGRGLYIWIYAYMCVSYTTMDYILGTHSSWLGLSWYFVIIKTPDSSVFPGFKTSNHNTKIRLPHQQIPATAPPSGCTQQSRFLFVFFGLQMHDVRVCVFV